MKTAPKALVAALLTLTPVVAFSTGPVHNIWVGKGIALNDPAGSYPIASTDGSISWNESTTQAVFNARVQANLGPTFEFVLVQPTLTTNYQIDGTWNVFKNGALVCSACTGSAYGLNGPLNTGFKLYINGGYHFSGSIYSRYDF